MLIFIEINVLPREILRHVTYMLTDGRP